MGGACSRRLPFRHSDRRTRDEGSAHSGTVVRGAVGRAVQDAPPLHHVGVTSAFALRDGFTGGGPHSLPLTTRSFRVWSSARGVVDNISEASQGGGSALSAALGCVSGRGISTQGDSSPSSPSSPQGQGILIPSSVHGAHNCSLHCTLCPALVQQSLQDKCISLLCHQMQSAPEDLSRQMLGMLTKDLTQRMLDAWIVSHSVTLSLLRSLGQQSVEVVNFGGYPGVSDKWMVALRPQARTLLKVDLRECRGVTNKGVLQLRRATNLRSLTLDLCTQVTDNALEVLLTGKCLRELSVEGCPLVSGTGLAHLQHLNSLTHLSLERCTHLERGLPHISHLSTLKVLNLGWCPKLKGDQVSHLSLLTSLEDLNLARTRTSDREALRVLRGMSGLTRLNLQGCPVSDASCEVIGGLGLLTELDLGWCGGVSDASLLNLRHLQHLRVLNLCYTCVGDGHASMFSELVCLDDLNLDSTHVSDASLAFLAEIPSLSSLDLSDTSVSDEGAAHLARMSSLQSLTLNFTSVTDAGVRHLGGLLTLKHLNLDSRLIGDRALSSLSSLTGLQSLDVFGCKVTDAGLFFVRGMKMLQSLQLCGGGVTDSGMKHLSGLSSLSTLNISQNPRISDSGLLHLSALTTLATLNLSGCKISGAGVMRLRALPRLRSLILHCTRVSRAALSRAQASPLCLWPSDFSAVGIK